MTEEKIKALEIVSYATDDGRGSKVVVIIKINPPRVNVERTLMGVLRNINTDNYFVREIKATDSDSDLKPQGKET